MITYSINRPEKKEPAKTTDKKSKKKKKEADAVAKTETKKPVVKFDSIFFQVLNEKQELIRTYERKAPKENGIHKMFWFLEEKGSARPSRRLARGRS